MVPSIRADGKQVKPVVLAQVISLAVPSDKASLRVREESGLSALPTI
jgi:hypothetical protein